MKNEQEPQHPFQKTVKKNAIDSLPELNGYNGLKPVSYMLVINVSEDVKEKILNVKKEFAEKFKADYYKYATPQIYVSTFLQYEMEEKKIINRITQIAKQIQPMQIVFEGYQSHPSHSIFINVKTKTEIRELSTALKNMRDAITINKWNKPWFVDEPEIAIAKKLLPYQYEKGWLEMQHQHFSGSFIAYEMVLLKKVNDKNFKAVYSFMFEGKKTIPTQAALFC